VAARGGSGVPVHYEQTVSTHVKGPAQRQRAELGVRIRRQRGVGDPVIGTRRGDSVRELESQAGRAVQVDPRLCSC
jgi:hypothetical protein